MPLPFNYLRSSVAFFTLAYIYGLNEINLYCYATITLVDLNADFPEYHFLLITENTVAGKLATTTGILDELTNAGVDVNDYYTVCDYFDVVPE